ncbi:MAG: CDP-glycerol glycerophosphotransferase family protein [Lachnospiraceae bacterium]|nr:CDP-glycerol glycerophosphotransferase family protein [Lachnospiraceae bacterium]
MDENQEKEARIAEEFLAAIDSGELNRDTLENYSCYSPACLLRTAMQIDHGAEQYLQIKRFVEGMILDRLREQAKIVVAFMAYDASTWIGDELFELLAQSDRFEPYVVLTSVFNEQSDELRLKQYRDNLRYFSERKVRLLPTIDPRDNSQFTWKKLGIRPHVCIWLCPYSIYRGDFEMLNMPLDILHIYIPYGFNVVGTPNAHFNLLTHLLMWRVFYESRATVKMAAEKCIIGDATAVYTGYPKIDAFYRNYDPNDGVWGRLMKKGDNAGKKRIIYSPHHTIEEWELLHFSTFLSNYRFMLEMAKKYREDTVWVFRPHPILKSKLLRAGTFASEAEWDAYVAEWDALDNAMSYEQGDYAELMMNSDAMIMDCGSFIGEYVYAQKPLLFLDSGKAIFNEFGEEIMQVHYRVPGDDFDAIEAFITGTVIGGEDSKAELRARYFRDNMDYRTESGGRSASQNIFDYLNEQLRRAW